MGARYERALVTTARTFPIRGKSAARIAGCSASKVTQGVRYERKEEDDEKG